METYDVIIIGTGAGGGTLAQQLAPSGKRILILERGDYIPREKENWDTKAVFIDGRYKADEHWKDKDGKKFAPGIHYCVGGNTKVYGAALFRMRKEDFGKLEHHGGVSPAWPIDYEDLQPYYLKAEELYSVHGLRGSDPTEPHDEHPYYQPPVPHEPRIQELFDDIKAQGHNPFPLPLGLRTSRMTAEAPYVLDRFDGYPDAAEMKADSHVICIREALEHPNVTMMTGCLVERLETDEEGKRVEKVIAKHQGKEITLSAKQVVVACGAINSAVLLLKSANDQHKNGLANGSGVVGRYYMAHNNSAVLAVSTTPNPTKFGKTLAINDFYFGDDDFEYPMGHIQMLGKSDGENLATDAPAIAPGFTLEYVAKHSVDFWMTSEDLPDPENRVIVSPEGHITLHYKENNIEGHKQLKKRLKKILEHAGCGDHILPNNFYLGKKIALAGTAHQCGTIRFGTDPTTSALNLNCRAHEVDNLYVVDGSFFPSSSAINPGLTIIAMAIKVGEHLKSEVL